MPPRKVQSTNMLMTWVCTSVSQSTDSPCFSSPTRTGLRNTGLLGAAWPCESIWLLMYVSWGRPIPFWLNNSVTTSTILSLILINLAQETCSYFTEWSVWPLLLPLLGESIGWHCLGRSCDLPFQSLLWLSLCIQHYFRTIFLLWLLYSARQLVP